MDGQFTISTLVFIVCLIVPGVIFKRFYFQGQFSKQFGAGLFADRLITSIFCGIIVQITTYLAVSKSLRFNYQDIHRQVEITYKTLTSNNLPNFSYVEISYILFYLLCSVFIAAFLGFLVHEIIVYLGLDVKFEVIRFQNEWHYYFKGKVLQMKEFKTTKQGRCLTTNIDLIIDDGNDVKKMVSGFLTQYTLSEKTGELNSLCLTEAKRFSRTSSDWKVIPGDCFIVSYDKVIDMNLLYNTDEGSIDK